MIYVFLGIQGSGKGTQAATLCKSFGYVHMNLGDLFRNHIDSMTEIGKEALSYISQGLLVPDMVVFKVVESAFKQPNKGMVLDGFPRTLQQAKYLTEHYTINKVFYLQLDDDIAMERMLARRMCNDCGGVYNILSKKPIVEGICDVCGKPLVKRADDNDIAIKNRLELFHKETMPLTDYFTKLGLLAVIDANGSIEVVDQRVHKALGL